MIKAPPAATGPSLAPGEGPKAGGALGRLAPVLFSPPRGEAGANLFIQKNI
jgi:hypothetical protein